MKFHRLNTSISLLFLPGVAAHSLNGDANHFLAEHNNLRGRDIGKVMLETTHGSKSKFLGENYFYCLPDEEEYLYADGSVMCHKSATHSESVVVVNDCSYGEYEVVDKGGTVHCVIITDGRKVTTPNCPQGEKPFVESDGSIVCEKVQAKTGPRKVPKNANMIDDQVAIIECPSGSERVVSEDGSVHCAEIRQAGTTVLYYDDDDGQKVVYVNDDDDGVVTPRNAQKDIPDGPCVDDDTYDPPPVTGANGNLLYGADCSTNRLNCMDPMTCQYMGDCHWTCKT